MLRRAWLLLGALWVAVALWSGANRGDGSGIRGEDVVLALAPPALLLAAWLGLRFVFTGSVSRPRVVPYRRP